MGEQMKLIDTLNRLILGRLRRAKPHLSMAGNTLIVGEEQFSLPEVKTIIAYNADIYGGTVVTLVLTFSIGKSVTIHQHDEVWDELIRLLDQLSLTRITSKEWLTTVMAQNEKQSPVVLCGGSTHKL